MTVEDLEIGQVYEVVEEFYSGYTVDAHPELESVFIGGLIKVGTLMKYVEHSKYRRGPGTSLVYGFHFIIAGKIAKNSFDDGGAFWFSEEELS